MHIDTTEIKIGKFPWYAHTNYGYENFKASDYTCSFVCLNHQKKLNKRIRLYKKGGKWIIFAPKIEIIDKLNLLDELFIEVKLNYIFIVNENFFQPYSTIHI